MMHGSENISFSLLPSVQTFSGAHPATHLLGVWGSFPLVR